MLLVDEFWLEQTTGSITAGKRADLDLLTADPTNDIQATTQTDSVILNGRYLDRRRLDTILAEPAPRARQSNE